MSSNHSHTGCADKRCKALTLTFGDLQDRSGPLAAPPFTRSDRRVDTHGLPRRVQPHQIQGHSHAEHVDRPRAREKQRVIRVEFIGAKQADEARAEGPRDVDHDAVG